MRNNIWNWNEHNLTIWNVKLSIFNVSSTSTATHTSKTGGHTSTHSTKNISSSKFQFRWEKNILIILGPVGYGPTMLLLRHPDIYNRTQGWMTSIGDQNPRNGIKMMKEKLESEYCGWQLKLGNIKSQGMDFQRNIFLYSQLECPNLDSD